MEFFLLLVGGLLACSTVVIWAFIGTFGATRETFPLPSRVTPNFNRRPQFTRFQQCYVVVTKCLPEGNYGHTRLSKKTECGFNWSDNSPRTVISHLHGL